MQHRSLLLTTHPLLLVATRDRKKQENKEASVKVPHLLLSSARSTKRNHVPLLFQQANTLFEISLISQCHNNHQSE